MSSTYNDILNEFDLEFFDNICPTELPDSKWDKRKKAVLLAKKKIIATDSLLKAYYEKKNAHEYTEKCLFESKVECKQVCIDYRKSLEKYADLEKENKKLCAETKSLNERLLEADDHYVALQSHTNQLQLFVKELKNQIEGYEVEKRLEKENAKDYEKRIRHLENDKQLLENDLDLLGDVIAGTKSIDKDIKKLLKKYNKTVKPEPKPSKEAESSDEGLGTPNTWPENVVHDGIDLSDMEHDDDDDADIIHTVIIVAEDDNDMPHETSDTNDSDFCNDIINSVDTGRGSSLALSPEYSINTPCAESQPKIVKDILPPVKVPTTCHRGVSPIIFENNSVFKCTQTSPDVRQTKKIKHIATSPIASTGNANAATQSDDVSCGSNNNNVCTMKVNEDRDVEVETILNAMRLPFEALSPLPPSPALSLAPSPAPDSVSCPAPGSALCPAPVSAPCPTLGTTPGFAPCTTPYTTSGFAPRTTPGSAPCPTPVTAPCPALVSAPCPTPVTAPCPALVSAPCTTPGFAPRPTPGSAPCPTPVSAPCPALGSAPCTTPGFAPRPTPGSAPCPTPVSAPCPALGSAPCTTPGSAPRPTPGSPLSPTPCTTPGPAPCTTPGSAPCTTPGSAPCPTEGIPQLSVEKLESVKIWQEFEMITTRLVKIEKVIHKKKNKKTNNKLADILTEAKIPARQEVPTIIIEETCVAEDEEDIIRIPVSIKKSMPSESREPDNNTKSRDALLDVRRRLEFSKPVPDNHKNNDATYDKTEFNDSPDLIALSEKKCRRTHNKLTKLQKLKVSLMPKSKIKNTIAPSKTLRSKAKLLKPLQNGKMTIQSESPSKALNNKAVYEKALAVVAEIRAKENNKEKQFKKIQVSPKKRNTETRDIGKADSPKNIVKQPAAIGNSNLNGENRLCTKPMTKVDTQNSSCSIPTEISPKRKRRSSDQLDPDLIISSTRRTTRSLLKEQEKNNNVCGSPEVQKLTNASEDTSSASSRSPKSRTSLKRPLDNNEDMQIRRKLRSSTRNSLDSTNESVTDASNTEIKPLINPKDSTKDSISNKNNVKTPVKQSDMLKDYNDLSLFAASADDAGKNDKNKKDHRKVNHDNLKESILCKMIEKHGRSYVKTASKKIPVKILDEITKTIEEGIEKVLPMKPTEAKAGMDEIVNKLRGVPLKHFLSGLMKYMKDPERKVELFNKTSAPPAPPMTKQQQVILYVITKLKNNWPSTNLISEILDTIQYAIYRLNNTPEFVTIESLSHFYAVLCRYSRAKYRLRQFMLDGMYCIGFKAVPLIRQVLEVWPLVLPLAHVGIAKQPLVTCLVYLLHFYKCEDVFHRVQDLRNILQKKYFYKIADWNETLIVDMLRSAILKKDVPAERKMLRMTIIILAKRHGPRWCEKNIIRGLLFPIIEDKNAKESSRCFAATLLGPLLRPFPNDMRLHREIVVNKLFDLLDTELSGSLEEAMYSSLVCVSRHDAGRVARALLLWAPRQPLSKEFEAQLTDYVREKPIKMWKSLLSNVFN